MRKSNAAAVNEQRKMFLGIISTLVFAILMGSFIVYFYESEPNLKGQILFRFGDKLEDSAVSAHWQWQAEGRPERILLVHYNSEGKETDRRPVVMGVTGWPGVKHTDDGCRKLWQRVLNKPMEVDGFRVRGDFYEGDTDTESGEPVNAYCRFGLSSGDYFDYAIYRGDVTYEDE